MTVQGIIFDLGWTLVDFVADYEREVEPRRIAALGECLARYGLPIEAPDLYRRFQAHQQVLREVGTPLLYEYPARLALLRALREALPDGLPDSLLDSAHQALYALLADYWEPYEDTFETVERLREAGYRLAILSNTNDDHHVRRIVDRSGLRPWFDPIHTSASLGLRKPHPRPFRLILETWALPPSEVVVVGDTLSADVLGAHRAGMRAIWVRRFSPISDNAEHEGRIIPEAVVERLGELPGVITGW